MNRGCFTGVNANLSQQALPNVYPYDGPSLSNPQKQPLIAAFSTFGANLVSATDKTSRLVLMVSPGTVVNGISQASIATPYTIDTHIAFVATPSSGAATVCGLFLSDGTKMRGFYAGIWQSAANTTSGTVRADVSSWTNSTTFSAEVKLASVCLNASDYYARITDDGVTRKFYLSANGLDFFQFYSEATNTFVTPSQFRIGVYNDGNGNTAKASIYNWQVTASVLGDAA